MDSDGDTDSVLGTGQEEDEMCPGGTLELGTTDNTDDLDPAVLQKQMTTIEQFMERQSSILTSLAEELNLVSMQQAQLNSRQKECEIMVRTVADGKVGGGAWGNVEDSNPDKYPFSGAVVNLTATADICPISAHPEEEGNQRSSHPRLGFEPASIDTKTLDLGPGFPQPRLRGRATVEPINLGVETLGQAAPPRVTIGTRSGVKLQKVMGQRVK